MISSKYKTLTIIYDNHTILEKTKETQIVEELEDNLDNLLNRLNRKVINNPHYCSVRLRPSTFLVVYIEPGLKNNPYLFLYNTKSQTYSFEIPYELFINLGNKYIMYDFEDKIRNIDKPLSISYEIFEILENLSKKANEYDKIEQL